MGAGATKIWTRKPKTEAEDPERRLKIQAIVQKVAGQPCPGFDENTETLEEFEVEEVLEWKEFNDLKLEDDYIDNVTRAACYARRAFMKSSVDSGFNHCRKEYNELMARIKAEAEEARGPPTDRTTLSDDSRS